MLSLDDSPTLPTTHIVGGFAVFTIPAMGDMETVATCCFQAVDLLFIAAQNGRVQFVWGKPDSTLLRIGAGEQQPFQPLHQASILRRL